MGNRDSYRWNPIGWGNTEGRKFVVETQFARRARQIPLTIPQRELVVGSLLGDGTLSPTTAGYCFRVHHGIKQAGYVEWKYSVLASVVRSTPKRCRNGYLFRTISHPEFSVLRKLFYPDSLKTIPIAFLKEQLSDLGLAVWLMDDGAADGRQVRLNTQSFSMEENEALIGFLRAKFGIDVGLNVDKSSYRLRVKSASMARLKSIVGPHILPSMLYKLPP